MMPRGRDLDSTSSCLSVESLIEGEELDPGFPDFEIVVPDGLRKHFRKIEGIIRFGFPSYLLSPEGGLAK
jgi:hypothetical protein